MNKTRLTSNLTFEILGALCIPAFLTFYVSNYKLNITVILILALIFLLFGLFIYFLLSLKKIEFDDDFIYVHKGSMEEKIPIKNIYHIKLLMGGINRKDFWKMKYKNNDNKEVSLIFVPKIMDRELFKLQEKIKLKNPDAQISNITTSFDI